VTAKANSPLHPITHKCHAEKFDNGKEFAKHETIAAELKVDIFICSPAPSLKAMLELEQQRLAMAVFPQGNGATPK